MARCGCSQNACACVLQDGVGTTVTGNGTPATPYHVNVTPADCATVRACFGELDTSSVDMHYNAATGVYSADVKLQAPAEGGANLIENDGSGLSVSCADVRTCFGVEDTATVNMTYDPVTGIFSAETIAGGDTVLGDGVNTVLTGDGSPGNPYTVSVPAGCGLEPDGSGGLRANVQVWPYPCDIATMGGGVYCDPATGELHSDPLDWNFVPGDSVLDPAPGGITPGNQICRTTGITAIGAANPILDCVDVSFIMQARFQWTVQGNPGDGYTVTGDILIDGVSTIGGPVTVFSDNNLSGGITSGTTALGDAAVFIQGSGPHTVEVIICIQNIGPTNLTVLTMGTAWDAMLNTRHP